MTGQRRMTNSQHRDASGKTVAGRDASGKTVADRDANGP
jgi:hypothetical protein